MKGFLVRLGVICGVVLAGMYLMNLWADQSVGWDLAPIIIEATEGSGQLKTFLISFGVLTVLSWRSLFGSKKG